MQLESCRQQGPIFVGEFYEEGAAIADVHNVLNAMHVHIIEVNFDLCLRFGSLALGRFLLLGEVGLQLLRVLRFVLPSFGIDEELLELLHLRLEPFASHQIFCSLGHFLLENPVSEPFRGGLRRGSRPNKLHFVEALQISVRPRDRKLRESLVNCLLVGLGELALPENCCHFLFCQSHWPVVVVRLEVGDAEFQSGPYLVELLSPGQSVLPPSPELGLLSAQVVLQSAVLLVSLPLLFLCLLVLESLGLDEGLEIVVGVSQRDDCDALVAATGKMPQCGLPLLAQHVSNSSWHDDIPGASGEVREQDRPQAAIIQSCDVVFHPGGIDGIQGIVRPSTAAETALG
mmetsp:Transcript_38949/g.82814  ORF Transcript_38949/g.82814 Transcript_38949/m.82814 type:complete len:344 (-) Transcript_38949:2307-3338(-)